MNKTYVLSDLHAHFEKLLLFLKDIDETDTVYVLGDIEDKGPQPLKCLLFLIDDKRFKLVLGNHDYMMYRFLIASKNNSLSSPSSEMISRYQDWIECNHGYSTLSEFENQSPKVQQKILQYLEKAKLIYPDLVVNNKHFVLVHAFPYFMIFDGEQPITKPLTMKDLKYNDGKINYFVWSRPLEDFSDHQPIKDKIVIVGHTPTKNFSKKSKKKHYTVYFNNKTLKNSNFIDIDCGLAYNDKNSRLCVLCLDDMKVKYY